MMSIFDNYTNLDPNYIPNNINSNIIPPSESIDMSPPPRVVKNINDDFDGYSWHSGEEFKFNIELDGNIGENKHLKLEIYNFKFHHLMSFVNNSNSNSISIDINKDLDNILLPGVYNCLLLVVGEDSVEVKRCFTLNII